MIFQGKKSSPKLCSNWVYRSLSISTFQFRIHGANSTYSALWICGSTSPFLSSQRWISRTLLTWFIICKIFSLRTNHEKTNKFLKCKHTPIGLSVEIGGSWNRRRQASYNMLRGGRSSVTSWYMIGYIPMDNCFHLCSVLAVGNTTCRARPMQHLMTSLITIHTYGSWFDCAALPWTIAIDLISHLHATQHFFSVKIRQQ